MAISEELREKISEGVKRAHERRSDFQRKIINQKISANTKKYYDEETDEKKIERKTAQQKSKTYAKNAASYMKERDLLYKMLTNILEETAKSKRKYANFYSDTIVNHFSKHFNFYDIAGIGYKVFLDNNKGTFECDFLLKEIGITLL